jgi:hypothetical protein
MIKGRYVIKVDGEIVAERDNLITTNGFYLINRHLVKSSIDWAGSIAIGAMAVAPSISDKELYYEIDRMPITLKSYVKMSPRYTLLNKKISSNIAYLSFKSITTPILNNSYKVQVTGVDSTFNGTYNLTSYSALQANITNISETAGTVTFTADNSFVAGETVIVSGVNPTQYNITGTIASASTTQFTVVNSATGSYVSGGTAVQKYAYQAVYSKTSTDVSLTSISGNSAILSVVSDELGNAIYNNEIVLKASLDPNLSARIYEVGALPINLKQANNAAIKNITGFSEKSNTDSSLSQWTSTATSSQVPVVGQTQINGSSLSQQSGYTWYTGTTNVVFNVGNTAGLKVGSNVYIDSTVAATGSTLAPSGSGVVYQVNGNYQVVVTMGTSNTTGSTQYGYAGTLSLNSTSIIQPSSYGAFNIKLNSTDTVTLNNIVVDATQFSSSDSLLLLYYSPTASNSTSITINLSDNNNSSSPFVCSATGIVTNIGLNVARIPLPSNYPINGITINQMSINLLTGGPSYIYLDSLKIITNDYWTGHPYAGTLSITSVSPSTPSAGFVTYTTAGSHNFAAGNNVAISGVSGGTGTGYSGTFSIYSITARNTFVVSNSTTGSATLTAPAQAVSSTTVIMPPEYQLTSRSLFTNPIIKNTGQQMDIEYHLQVT